MVSDFSLPICIALILTLQLQKQCIQPTSVLSCEVIQGRVQNWVQWHNKMNKQNIVLTGGKMHQRKKSKTQKSPRNQIKLYKSVNSKQPYFVKNKHSIVRDTPQSHSKDVKTTTSVWGKATQENTRANQSRKVHKFAEGSLGSSNCQSCEPGAHISKVIQTSHNESRSRETRQSKIEDLLGIGSSQLSKKTSIVASVHQITNQTSICNDSYENQMEKLRIQNRQLMKVNEMLLYEKEYYKQKNILQEVQIRQQNRKINELSSLISAKKTHQKNKSQSQESDLTFKFKVENEKENKNNEMNSLRQTKQHRIINLATHTQKSSLLVSESEEDRIPLKSRENLDFGQAESTSQVRKTEKQFSQLLECVQNETNIHRKTTLRKMLAIKAMELKKVKQKY